VTAVDWDGEVLWERDDPLVDGPYVVFREGADGRPGDMLLRYCDAPQFDDDAVLASCRLLSPAVADGGDLVADGGDRRH